MPVDPEVVTELASSLLEIQPFGIEKNAITMRDVTKGYGLKNKNVLKGLNMSVPRGTIYGLLGPSGCGKTTLLRCMVGSERVKKGVIKVFGHPPGTPESGIPGPRVGYMPQDYALYEMLTPDEILTFFGEVFGMAQSQLIDRKDFLFQFLQITSYRSKIMLYLSGGQKRRVSLALALLHEPELLILDEPTVGLDPLLRQFVWDHLYLLTRKLNVTAVITTHYIEEARMAHRVGLMLRGKLLAEGPPQKLIQDHRCNTLEEVFLKLCVFRKDADDSDGEESPSGRQGEAGQEMKPLSPFISRNSASAMPKNDSIPQIVIESTNGMCLLSDSPDPDRLSCHSLPTFVPSRRNSLVEEYQRMLDLKAGPVQDSHKMAPFFLSQRFGGGILNPSVIDHLKSLIKKNFKFFSRHPGAVLMQFALPAFVMLVFALTVGKDLNNLKLGVVNLDTGGLGLLYLDRMDKDQITLVPYDSYESAYSDAAVGKTWGVLFFGPNFSDGLVRRLERGALVDNETLFDSSIHARLDMSNQQVSFLLRLLMFNTFQDFVQDVLERIGLSRMMGTLPILFHNPIYGTEDAQFAQFLLPSFIVCVVFFICLGLTTLYFLMERECGVWERAIVSGIKTMEIILAQLTVQTMFVFGQIAFILIVVLVFFSFECQGSLVLVVFLSVLQGICGMALGMTVAAVCNEQLLGIVICLGCFFFAILLEGVIWPAESLPYFFQQLCALLPHTQAIEGMRSIMGRGWDFTYPAVYTGFFYTSVWIAIFLTACWAVMKLKK